MKEKERTVVEYNYIETQILGSKLGDLSLTSTKLKETLKGKQTKLKVNTVKQLSVRWVM